MNFLSTIKHFFKKYNRTYFIKFNNKSELQIFLSLCQTYNIRWASGTMALEKLEWALEIISEDNVIAIEKLKEISICISRENSSDIDFMDIYKLSGIVNVPNSLKRIY